MWLKELRMVKLNAVEGVVQGEVNTHILVQLVMGPKAGVTAAVAHSHLNC